MGAFADAALAAGGKVIGVIPTRLVEYEIAHAGLTELHVVETMHERKALMSELSDAVIALPGGTGTLDELFELFTWRQLGLHHKPLGLLDVADYWQPLLRFLEHAVNERFLRAETLRTLLVERSAEVLLDRLASYEHREKDKWLDRAGEDQTVPNTRSPASPRPGRMDAFSSSSRSTAAVQIRTSGCSSCTAAIPWGADTRHTSSRCPAPARLSLSSACTALPPVASIGSSTYTREDGSRGGSRS
jgi:uncharacterized protein (TIGR00730 family)